jgi:Protein of unknown function (DUF4056)
MTKTQNVEATSPDNGARVQAVLATASRYLLLAGLLASVAGCSGMPPPRMRLGSIPYPGLFNLFKLADPSDLGEHHYELAEPNDSEADQGVIYACNAGFLDIGHIRDTIDLAYYMQRRLERAILAHHTQVELPTNVPSTLLLTLDYADFWRGLAGRDEARIAHELSIVMSQRLAYLAGIWHEAVTWMGYRSTGVFAEDRSAFTYEDIMSHMIGVMIAARVLRDTGDDYDQAATLALRQAIDGLGPVSPEIANKAIGLVEGKWWKDGNSLKRYLDVGLDDETIEPWLVPNLEGCDVKRSPSYSLPSMASVSGRDYSGFYTVAIEPRGIVASWLGQRFGYPPEELDVKVDLPRIMSRIRAEMAVTMGPDLDNPDPDGELSRYLARGATRVVPGSRHTGGSARTVRE